MVLRTFPPHLAFGHKWSYSVYIQTRYEWDQRTNRANQRKHGISFELAALVFEDENRLIRLDRVDETGEQRWQAIGAVSPRAGLEAVLLVVHVYRCVGNENKPRRAPWEDYDGEENIRIISARQAGKDDVRSYQKQELVEG